MNIRAAGERNLADERTNNQTASELPGFFVVRRYVDQLAGFYELRARRQQQFSDVAAAGTFTGALGAGLSGRVGAATQHAWLGAAFAPIMISSVNANESTRDLYHAGALALRAIDARYLRMTETLAALDNIQLAAPPDCENATGKDAKYNVKTASEWSAADDRAPILPEAQRLLSECLLIGLANQQVALFRESARVAQTRWASDLASATITLDQTLLNKDRQFRYSPAETLGAIAAAPFRTMDSILSGQDASQALSKLQTSAAFSGMDMSLKPVRLPSPTEALQPIDLLSAAAEARLTARVRTTTQDREVVDVVTRLKSLAVDLIAARGRHQHAQTLIAEFYAAAAATELKFNYDTTNSLVTIQLEAASN